MKSSLSGMWPIYRGALTVHALGLLRNNFGFYQVRFPFSEVLPRNLALPGQHPLITTLYTAPSFINAGERRHYSTADSGDEKLKHSPSVGGSDDDSEVEEPINLGSGDDYKRVESRSGGGEAAAGAGGELPVIRPQEAGDVAYITAYDLLDRPELNEAEKLLVSDELDRRLLNIGNTILGRDDIESLDSLARALGLDIREVMRSNFGGTVDLYEAIQDLKALIQNFTQGTLLRADHQYLAELLYVFKLDGGFLSRVSVRASDGWAWMVCELVSEKIKECQEKSKPVALSGEEKSNEPADLE
jgi:hypothetical protein